KGSANDEGFRLQRIIYYRNSFLPVVKGRFVEGNLGTDILVSMTLHPLVLLFMLVWFGLLASMVVSVVRDGSNLAMLPMPFGLILFGWIVVQLGFSSEADKARKIIQDLFVNAS